MIVKKNALLRRIGVGLGDYFKSEVTGSVYKIIAPPRVKSYGTTRKTRLIEITAEVSIYSEEGKTIMPFEETCLLIYRQSRKEGFSFISMPEITPIPKPEDSYK